MGMALLTDLSIMPALKVDWAPGTQQDILRHQAKLQGKSAKDNPENSAGFAILSKEPE